MKKKQWTDEVDFDTLMDYKPMKVVVYATAILITLILAGYTFKITAHTIRGYKELRNALKA